MPPSPLHTHTHTLHGELQGVSLPQLAVLWGDELFPDGTKPQLQNVLQFLYNLHGNAYLRLKVMVLVVVLRQICQTKHSSTWNQTTSKTGLSEETVWSKITCKMGVSAWSKISCKMGISNKIQLDPTSEARWAYQLKHLIKVPCRMGA